MVLRDASASKNTASLKMSRLTGGFFFVKLPPEKYCLPPHQRQRLHALSIKPRHFHINSGFRPRPKNFKFQVCILTNLEVDWQFIKKSSLVQCAYSSNLLKYVHLHIDHKYYSLNTLGWQSWIFRVVKCQKYETRSRHVVPIWWLNYLHRQFLYSLFYLL